MRGWHPLNIVTGGYIERVIRVSERTAGVDETELIEELLRGGGDDPARLRHVCELVFDNEGVADRPDLVRTAATARRAFMRHPVPGLDPIAGRLYQFRDDLTTVKAEIHGGPSRTFEAC